MIQVWYQNLPLHIDPIAFAVGSFSMRWYALSYIVGFAVVYLILIWRINHETLEVYQILNFKFLILNKPKGSSNKKAISDEISNLKFRISNLLVDFLLMAFFAALVGGRLGFVLLYNFSYYAAHPLAIISPYDQAGNFMGFYGMSYHGALVGVLAGSWIFLKIKKISFWAWADFVAPAAALGYFFGRIGNFLNGELYGRATSSPLGMYFPLGGDALRHPSQLYEAALEGLVLFGLLWMLRKKKFPKGVLLATYLAGYGFFRILVEQFREPDPQISLIFGFFTIGQMLSLLMMFTGAVVFFKKRKDA